MSRCLRPSATRAIGWYVHVPFCDGKCGYCDFYSVLLQADAATDFLAGIGREIAERDPQRPVATVFIGGGTPTVLPEVDLRTLLNAVVARTGSVAEFTVEANPATADRHKLELLSEAGVNRLSLGVQSMHDDDLRLLERRHTVADVLASISQARAAGFTNLGVDLIYALPGQRLERWRDTLRRAIDVRPEHVSCYSLTYEPDTVFTRRLHGGELVAVDEGLDVEMLLLTIDELTAAGYEHYEISNFAKPGRCCQANLIYWMNQEYLGVGPSAVSYLDGVRRRNVADVQTYVTGMKRGAAAIVTDEECLPPLARAGETAVQMLRLMEGISIRKFYQATGFDPGAIFREPIERFTRLGLLQRTPKAIRLTRAGLLVANRVMQEFLVDDSDSPAEAQQVPGEAPAEFGPAESTEPG